MIKLGSPKKFTSKKIKSQEEISGIIKILKENGKKIGLCVGGFDLLHAGHMIHLRSAKELCDFLVVGITDDYFLKKAKGKERPIYSSRIRAYSLSQLECVDVIFIRASDSAVEAIRSLRPDFYIKGPECKDNDYAPGIIEERKAVADTRGKMRYTSDETLSTTEIIKHIKNV